MPESELGPDSWEQVVEGQRLKLFIADEDAWFRY